MAKKKITILGSSGSIGRSTLDIVNNHSDKFEIVGLTINKDYSTLIKQIKIFNPKVVAIKDEEAYKKFKSESNFDNVTVLGGNECLTDILDFSVDFVMASIVGSAGLLPILKAAKKGYTIGLANKESLVCSGSILKEVVRKNNSNILPIDSEHNAIFQVFENENKSEIEKIILTASGGPFVGKTIKDLKNVSPNDAIKHPNWSMGKKISVDSATLMNKGLEVIEAHYLFDIPIEKIDVLVHPQSIVHSCVEYADGSILAQMGSPDMKTPIAYALAYPKRINAPVERLSLSKISQLTFQEPDYHTFPALKLAMEALKIKQNAPTILNAANEVAVEAFLDKKISFLSISKIVDLTLNKAKICKIKSLDDLLEEDRLARKMANEIVLSI